MKPTVGRIVHYQAYGTPGGEYPSVPRAAIITQVHPAPEDTVPDVGLVIFNPTGFFLNPQIPFADTPKAGCWNWPPRVE